ncbi:MAG: septum formation initiator family protein [Candidatus Uhrbacteria bacterium]|nr:septum formation initiator family protein [Candidatus Uhrbacteria bacterium]
MSSPRGTFVERLIRWRLLLVVNFLVIGFLGVSLSREVVRTRTISAEIAQLQAQADELAAQNIDLSELSTAMQTESYIEREARLKLGMKKPGETVVVVQEEAESLTNEETANANDPLGLVLDDASATVAVANPSKWWYYFFDQNTFNALSDYE